MKIAMVCWGLAPPFGLGGTSRYVNRLANQLAVLDHDVTVFYAHGYTEKSPQDNFRAVRIPVSSVPVLRLFEFGRLLNRLLAGGTFDVVHAHIPPLAWGVNLSLPLVLTVHTTSSGEAIGIRKGGISSFSDLLRILVFSTIGKAMEYSVVRKACAITVVNPSYMEEVRNVCRNQTGDLRFIEPAVERSNLVRYDRVYARKALNVSESDFLVLFVGRLDSRKNPLALLDGFYQAVRKGIPNLRLFLCGDGSLRSILERRIAALSLGGMVSALGWVDERTLSLAYSAADVYLLPSEVEGFPVTLLECRFFGLPAIVGPFPGVERAIENNLTGIVLETVTGHSIANAIQSFVENPNLLRNMASNAAEMAAMSNTWSTVASKMVEVYSSAISRK
jgi:glycosyltransferase involved in cell wall biosynthesis